MREKPLKSSSKDKNNPIKLKEKDFNNEDFPGKIIQFKYHSIMNFKKLRECINYHTLKNLFS